MFCPNCGKECPDSAVFCGGCGTSLQNVKPPAPEAPVAPVENYPPVAPVAPPVGNFEPEVPVAPVENFEPVTPFSPIETYQNEVPTPDYFVNNQINEPVNSNPVPPVNNPQTIDDFYSEPPAPKKSGVKPVPIIIAVSVVVVLASVIFVLFPFFKNQFRNLFYSNEKYMSAVINDDVDDFADGFSKYYDKLINFEKNNGKGSASVNVSPRARKLLKNIPGGSSLSNIEDASIDFENAVKGNSAYVNATATLNGESVIEASVVADDGSVYVKTDATGDDYYEVPDINSPVIENIGSVNKSLPDKGTVKKLIDKYGKLATKNFESVDKTNKTVKFGDIKKDTVQLSAEIDSEYAYETLAEILKTAKDDKDLKKVIEDIVDSDLVDADSDKAMEEYEDGIDYLLDHLDQDNFKALDELDCTFILNVDSFGNVVCRTLKVDKYEVSLYTLTDGSKIAYGVVVKADRQEITVSAEGTKKGNKATGDITIQYNGLLIKLAKFEDVDLHDVKNGKMSGKIIITGSSLPIDNIIRDDSLADFIKDSEIVYDFNITDNSVSESLIWNSDDEEILSLNFSFDKKNISVPSIDSGDTDELTSKQTREIEEQLEDFTSYFRYSPKKSYSRAYQDYYDDFDDYDDYDY